MGRFSTYGRGAGQGLSNFSDPLVSSPESDGSGGFLGFSRSPCSAPELLIEVINGKRNRPPGWCLYPELERPRYREEGTPLQSTPSGRPTFAGNGAEDPAEGFSGQFVQNTATMSWSVSSLGNVYQSARRTPPSASLRKWDQSIMASSSRNWVLHGPKSVSFPIPGKSRGQKRGIEDASG
jgi:hypothetical protein